MCIWKCSESISEKTIIGYFPNIFTPETAERVTKWLEHLEYIEGITSSGASIDRLQLWYQRDGHYFGKRWKTLHPRWKSHEYEQILLSIQDTVQHKLNDIAMDISVPLINSCLINKYRNGNDFITPHRDNINSFGESPTIAGLSFGATRTLRLTHLITGHVQDIELEDNSMFIMAGASQKFYTHEILRDPEISSVRYSLTFREYIC